MSTYYFTLASPLGPLMLTTDGEHLTGLLFDGIPATNFVKDRKSVKFAIDEVSAYLAGELKVFSIPLKQPGTPFQQDVWKQLQKIDYGTTASYQDVARRIRKPLAMRAVGTANGRNRIAIVVPCHRVIAADGHIGGYGGGIWRKKWLLNLERD